MKALPLRRGGGTLLSPAVAAFTGSPLQFFVDAVNTGVVTAYGPGLSYGMVNKAATFTVVTKNAGEGSATLALLVVVVVGGW